MVDSDDSKTGHPMMSQIMKVVDQSNGKETDISPLSLGSTRGPHALFFNFLANFGGPQIGNLGSTVT